MPGDFRVGDWLVQPDLNLISNREKTIQIEPRVIEVLRHLAEHPGEVLSKEKIIAAVWPGTFVTDEALTYSISELRKALGDDARNPRFIQTIARRGYRLIAPVERMEQAAQPAAPVETNPSAPAAGGTARGTGRKRGRLIALTALPLVVVASYFLLRLLPYSSPPASPQTGRVVLAVLPLANLSADPEQEYFSDGLTEELITQLGRLQPEKLRVIARTSSMQYKGMQKKIDQIGRELGANYILEGSVRREGERVRISAQLIQVSDQTHAWAESYDRELSGILDVQNEVAAAVVQKIRLALSEKEQTRLASKRPVVPEAHLAYLKGRFHWNLRTPQDLRMAVEYFEEAIRRDPLYAPAYAGLADACILLNEYSDLAPQEAFVKARAAASKALELDPELAEAHASSAMLKYCQDWDWLGAEEEFKLAISLNPSYTTAHHWYSNLLATLGRFDEAETEIRHAIEIDMLSAVSRTALAWRVYAAAGKYDKAMQEALAAIELSPVYAIGHRRLGIIFLLKGRTEQALEEIKKGVLAADEAPLALSDLGHAYAALGRKSEALKVLNELKQLAKQRYVDASRIALIYVGLGEMDQAMNWLQRAYDQRDVGLVVIKVDPRFAPLRDDPRFRTILLNMRLLN